MNDILKGLRIVEGSAFVAAPLGGMTMAQMGADVIRFEEELLAHMRDRQQDLMKQIQESRDLSDDTKQKLDAALADFASSFRSSQA